MEQINCPRPHASANISVNTLAVDDAFECGQVLDCCSTNSVFDPFVPINRPEQTTLFQGESLFEFCAETSRQQPQPQHQTTADARFYKQIDQIESKLVKLQKNKDILTNKIDDLQTSNTQLFDIVTGFGTDLADQGRVNDHAEEHQLQRTIELNLLMAPVMAIFQKTLTLTKMK